MRKAAEGRAEKAQKKVQRSAKNTRFSIFYLVLPQLLL